VKGKKEIKRESSLNEMIFFILSFSSIVTGGIEHLKGNQKRNHYLPLPTTTTININLHLIYHHQKGKREMTLDNFQDKKNTLHSLFFFLHSWWWPFHVFQHIQKH